MFVDHESAPPVQTLFCLGRDVDRNRDNGDEFLWEVDGWDFIARFSRCGEQELDKTATSKHCKELTIKRMQLPFPFPPMQLSNPYD